MWDTFVAVILFLVLPVLALSLIGDVLRALRR